jgi:hypothetical protein
MLQALRHRIHLTVQRYALGGIGGLMTLIGLGFLSASGFMLLLTVTDPITASAIFGCGFFGLGLILMVMARKPPRPAHSAPLSGAQAGQQPETSPMPPLAAAFAQGVAQGMAARRQ